MAAHGQIGLHPLLGGPKAQLLETRGLPLGEGLVGEVGQGRPPPQAQGLGEGGTGRGAVASLQRLSPLLHPRLEAQEVELLGGDLEDVAGGASEQRG